MRQNPEPIDRRKLLLAGAAFVFLPAGLSAKERDPERRERRLRRRRGIHRREIRRRRRRERRNDGVQDLRDHFDKLQDRRERAEEIGRERQERGRLREIAATREWFNTGVARAWRGRISSLQSGMSERRADAIYHDRVRELAQQRDDRLREIARRYWQE